MTKVETVHLGPCPGVIRVSTKSWAPNVVISQFVDRPPYLLGTLCSLCCTRTLLDGRMPTTSDA